MEYVFEDFIFGFIDKELESVSAKAHRSSVYLDEAKTFNLQPDLSLKINGKSLIADTKYKIIYSDPTDPHKGISQQDLYQMIAYAIRFEAEDIILFYPNTIIDNQENFSEFVVRDTLANGKKIAIKAFQLPIINKALLNNGLEPSKDLNELFKPTKEKLRKRIENILLGRYCIQ